MNDTTSTTQGSVSRLLRKLGRLGRFIVFLCTAGWIFPHVCTEDLDLTKIQNDQMANKP